MPDKADKIEVLKIDVGDNESVLAAAKILRDRNVKLYGLVNNAGISPKGNEISVVINTNFNGPKRVTDAFLDLIDATEGRIVNTSSGAASMWLKNQVQQNIYDTHQKNSHNPSPLDIFIVWKFLLQGEVSTNNNIKVKDWP